MRKKAQRLTAIVLTILGSLSVACTQASAQDVAAQDIGALQDLGPAIGKCFNPPDGTSGSQVTVRFSLDRAGHLIGAPRVTYRHLVGTDDQRQAFLAAATRALQSCTPLQLTPELAGAIAGQPITVTFGTRRPVTRLQDS